MSSENNQKPTVKEHFVPVFYLRSFANENDMAWVWDFEKKCPKLIKIDNICFENDLYEAKYKGSDNSSQYIARNEIEENFHNLEGQYASFVKRVQCVCIPEQSRNALILRQEDKQILWSMAANFLLRNPRSLEQLGVLDLSEETRQSDLFRSLKAAIDAIGFGPGTTEAVFVAAQKKATLLEEMDGSVACGIVDSLKNLDFSFYYAKDGTFITSDIPICFGDDKSIRREDTTCLWFALTPKVSVLFGNYKESRNHRNRMVAVSREIVDDFNMQVVKKRHWDRWVIASDAETLQRYFDD